MNFSNNILSCAACLSIISILFSNSTKIYVLNASPIILKSTVGVASSTTMFFSSTFSITVAVSDFSTFSTEEATEFIIEILSFFSCGFTYSVSRKSIVFSSFDLRVSVDLISLGLTVSGFGAVKLSLLTSVCVSGFILNLNSESNFLLLINLVRLKFEFS